MEGGAIEGAAGELGGEALLEQVGGDGTREHLGQGFGEDGGEGGFKAVGSGQEGTGGKAGSAVLVGVGAQ